MIFFLKWYLQVNLLVAITFVIFRLCRTYISVGPHKPSFRSLNRVAQALLIASIFFPTALVIIPEKKLPKFQFETVRPISEALSLSHSPPSSTEFNSTEFTNTKAAPKNNFSLVSMLGKLKELARREILVLLGIGTLMMIIRLCKSITNIRRILSDGMAIRRLGRTVVLVSDSISVPFSTWLA